MHDLQRTVGNRAAQRMLEAASERGRGHAATIVTDHQHTFSATIRRPPTPRQSDSMNADEPTSEMGVETPPTQRAVGAPRRLTREPREGETVRFPSNMLQAAALPGQSDSIAATFGYSGSITEVPAPAKPTKFGDTLPFYEFASPGPTATPSNGTFTITGTINARITFWVDGGTRRDIASDTDPNITQANYPDVVRDLTPSPAAVNKGGTSLFKNQPPRKGFWAKDLTIKHERFHGREDVKFGKVGLDQAQKWLNNQTAKDLDAVGDLLNHINPMITKTVDAAMALPGRENRAYADGAQEYGSRAQAIKTKGDAKGYAPKPPAPKAAPATTPKAPSKP
jgi:hypothetical protein